ncbi:hypothetical protein [Paracoccus lutimaris]|uniref:Uncharacterized protein n=1 Tax=Paracoccus lutimaris TaxID=1490030 RepID=A0A368Z502_9RHOB|nr:hypothetical protein [Paracoccus lutimaris]RCW87049.1 hypothetical protein DFP89_10353 [Paracoccus lutimaris]
MPRYFGRLLIALSLGLASPALAQDAAAPGPDSRVMLELNGASDTKAGGCQLTIVATNQLETGIKRAAWQVAIFDKAGAVQSLPILDFGGMIAGKTRVGLFPLPDRPCADIGRIVVNDVAECSAEDGADLRDICLGGLATQTRTDIDFGL